MFRFIICLILLLHVNFSYADIITTTGIGPNYRGFQSNLNMNRPKTTIISNSPSRYRNNYNPHRCHRHPHYSNRDLSRLEQYALNRTYRSQNDLQRLERLENLAFGATQYGDLDSRYRNVETAILSRPTEQNIKRSIIGNLANYFGGQLTGLTPSISSDSFTNINPLGGYSNNYPSYSNTNFEQYSNGLFGGHGWGMNGQNFGNGTSVRILD